MIEQEHTSYSDEEIKAMVKTIEQLREENNAYKELAKMNEKQFKEMQNMLAQYRQPINELKDLWHPGNEKPTRQINSNYVYYALCIFWYDGWKEELCKINEDGTFTDSNEKYVFEFCGFCGEFEENYSDMCWLSVDVDNQWSEIGQTFIEDFINSFEEITFDEFMNKYDEYREKHDKAFRKWVNSYKEYS